MNRPLYLACGAALLVASNAAFAGAFTASAGTSRPITSVTHPKGYVGTGGVITNTVCLRTDVLPTGVSAATVEATLKKAVRTWNRQRAVTNNLSRPFGNNDISTSGQFDYESVLIHEMGHCLGLSHPNLATESGVANADRDYTQAREGTNAIFDMNAGTDGIKGSSDDVRGDDVNRYWFRKNSNDPMAFPSVIDPSTFSVDLADLPAGHSFAANGDRAVLAALGYPNAESAMQQGQFNNEAQRRITPEDLSTIRIGMAGVDDTQGTVDDYTLRLTYNGQISGADSCDINVNFNPDNSFAFCSFGFFAINTSHFRISSAVVSLDAAANWYFSPTENTDVSVSTSPTTLTSGTATTMNVSVNRLSADMTGTPPGSVEVSLGGQSCTATLSAADADTSSGSCSLTPSGNGSQTLTALYLGDAGFDASEISSSVTVGNAAPGGQIFQNGFE